MFRLLLISAVALLSGVAVWFMVRNYDFKKTADQTDCAKLTRDQLSSERSLGLVISGRRLLAVKLATEKNYSPPGGHVEVGESYREALVRELQEEVNLKINQDDLSEFKVVCEPRYGSIERTHYYLLNTVPGSIAVDDKNDRLKWVSYGYSDNKRSDTELTSALLFLKQQNLID